MILMAMYAQQSLNLTVGVLMIPLSWNDFFDY
jgi:hypothetical protein